MFYLFFILGRESLEFDLICIFLIGFDTSFCWVLKVLFQFLFYFIYKRFLSSSFFYVLRIRKKLFGFFILGREILNFDMIIYLI
jgi:hypothetical protein